MHIFNMISEANLSPISITKDMTKPVYRYKDLTKQDIIKACWLSLQDGASSEDTVHLIAAKVSDKTLNWLESTAKTKIKIHNIPTMDDPLPGIGQHPFTKYMEVRVNHFIPQYEYMFDIIEQDPSNIYYITSDDYLHIPNSLNKIKEFYYTNNFEGFFVPQDYPDNYHGDNINARIYATNAGYMRTVRSATPTVVAKGNLWLYFKHELLKASVFANDGWTWRAFGLVQALTPLPGWATHLQENQISPYIDWYSIAKGYLNE